MPPADDPPALASRRLTALDRNAHTLVGGRSGNPPLIRPAAS
ncbi:hypothetical protein OG226_23020 [Streptomyces sp. NBC_01261]|nr:hypothetical protein [Streptomyces sp. NBC_01261]